MLSKPVLTEWKNREQELREEKKDKIYYETEILFHGHQKGQKGGQ